MTMWKHVKCDKCPVEDFCPYANRHDKDQNCKLRKIVEEREK